MAAKDLHKESFSEETITKLDIFEKYLEAWLPVAIKSTYINKVNICDLFSGPGKDVDGIKGSPLRTIDVVRKYEDQIIKHKLTIDIYFNEYTKWKYKELCSYIKSEELSLKKLNNFLNIQTYNEDFKLLFESIKTKLISDFNLIFLDQSGIKQVTEDIFLNIVKLQKTDFMFFISSSYFKRFASDQSFQKYHPELNILEISKTKQSKMHRLILDYYKSKIPDNSKVKLYPFTIKKGANIYGLIFGAGHPRGIDKFLNIAWKKNELNGDANFDIDDDWQAKQGVLFGEKKLSKIEKYQIELERYIFSKKKITNLELYDYTLENGHIPKHTVDVVKKLKRNNKIAYSGYPNISYTKCYKDREYKFFKVL